MKNIKADYIEKLVDIMKNNEITEVSIEELINRNIEDTTISIVKKDYVSVCFLRKCNAFVHCYNPRRFADKWVRFGSKQMWVSNCINNRYFLVISYNTLVAVIDDQQGELYELGKWSVTTSKQVTQLYNLSDTESYNKFGFSKLTARYLVK